MTHLRLLTSRYRLFVLWLGLAVLCLRVLVPAGFMPVVEGGGLSLRLCSGMAAPTPVTAHTSMPGMGAHHADEHPPEHEQQPEQPCGFAGLTMPSLGVVDMVLPVAIAAPLRTGVSGSDTTSLAVAPAHLRPPPIGPPPIA